MPPFKRFRYLENEPSSGGGGNPPAPPPAPPQNPLKTIPIELLPDEWKDHARDLRKENAKLSAALKASETTLAEAVAEAVSKAEKASGEKLTAAEKAGQERLIRAELKASAVKAGMVDLDGLKLADLSKVKLNAEGDVEGADELMTEMKKAKPYLFGTPNSSNPKTPPSNTPPAAKNAKDMTPEEHKAAKAALLAASR
jgi:hypothetical protein